MSIHRIAALLLAGLFVAQFGGRTSLAGDNATAARPSHAATSEFSAQKRRARRARTRIQVYPRAYANPGPNAKRDCVSWLEREWRPSGTVVVPRLRCWWIPG